MALSQTARSKKIMTEALKLFYCNNPRQLELLTLKMHRNAMHDAAFAKLILDRVEGPVAQVVDHTGEIRHLVSDADRHSAQEAVTRIKQLQDATDVPFEDLPQLPEPKEP